MTMWPVGRFLTFCRFIFNGLLEERDVSEGAEEKHHLVIFIFNGRDLHVQPYWRPCGWGGDDSHSEVTDDDDVDDNDTKTRLEAQPGLLICAGTHCSLCRAAPRRTGTRSYQMSSGFCLSSSYRSGHRT